MVLGLIEPDEALDALSELSELFAGREHVLMSFDTERLKFGDELPVLIGMVSRIVFVVRGSVPVEDPEEAESYLGTWPYLALNLVIVALVSTGALLATYLLVSR